MLVKPLPMLKLQTGATVQDLLRTSIQNNASHLTCIREVNAWQSFWTDYVNATR